MTVEAPPSDRGRVVRYLLTLIAFVPLLSWNFFTMLTGYWMFKFRDLELDLYLDQVDPDWRVNVTSRTTIQSSFDMFLNSIVASPTHARFTLSSLDVVKNALQVDFTSYMVVACLTPTIILPLINGALGHRFKIMPRLVASLGVLTMVVAFHLAMTVINTDAWQRIFLFVTLSTVFLLGASSAVFTCSFTGLIGCFPRDYMWALLQGQSACALFSAAANILLLSVSADDIYVAFLCLSLTMIMHLAAFFALAGVSKTAFYKHYAASPVPTQEEERPLLGRAAAPQNISLASIAWRIRLELVTIFLLYVITLACHPGLTVLVEATGLHSGSATLWEEVYFVPVNCFLCFAIGNFLGRSVIKYLPIPSPTLTLLLTLLRVLALPLFLVCNLMPRQRHFTPVLIHSDIVYTAIMLIFSISTGFLTSVVMVGVKTRTREYEHQTATNLMVGVRGVGLVVGSAVSVLMVKLL